MLHTYKNIIPPDTFPPNLKGLWSSDAEEGASTQQQQGLHLWTISHDLTRGHKAGEIGWKDDGWMDDGCKDLVVSGKIEMSWDIHSHQIV